MKRPETDHPSPQPYPAITACICETRPPDRNEIRLVTSRMWREAFQQSDDPQSPGTRFGAYRRLLRAAIAALNGADSLDRRVKASRRNSVALGWRR